MLELICSVLMLVIGVIGFGLIALMLVMGIIGFWCEFRDLMVRLKKHCKRWNQWRKRNIGNKFYKFLVLIGLQFSPTMALMLTDEEINDISKGLDELFVTARDSAINLVEEVTEDDNE